MRVLAALSGGVDSAVAAARAVEAGHDVVGVHLALARDRAGGHLAVTPGSPGGAASGVVAPLPTRGCCSVEDSRDAARAADVLGIPYYVWDFSERFEREVVDDFVDSYAAGSTPNPCLRCNEKIKFSALLDKAIALGFDAVCTGHYARLDHHGDGSVRLRRAVDPAKDQSYVLAVLGPQALAHAMFPVGDTTKDRIRAEAARRGLSVAAKPDSHDICFIPDGDTAAWLTRRLGPQPGEVVDAQGRVVGRHAGAFAYTVGQRRGLHLGVPATDGRPRYVLSVEPVQRRVVVGALDDLDVHRLVGERPIWCGPPPVAGQSVAVQVRAHADPVPGELVSLDEGGVVARLAEPVRGVAPGQAMVLYDGERVLGSATVRRDEAPRVGRTA